MGQWMTLTASDGFRLAAYRSDPIGKPRGGLVIVQEIFGVNGHIRAVCDGYAAEGYAAVAPALFDRYQRNFDIGYSAEDIARGRELKGRSDIDAALRDVAAARDEAASAGRVGIIGDCWGGLVTWMSAARLAGFACAVPYYGGGMPDAAGEQPKCPVMAHFGKRDAAIPLEGVEKLAAAHPEVQVFLYDAEHGFNCDQRKRFVPASAALARERTLEFLHANVG
jgi:carboxymethylenebutenolidase